MEEAFNHRVLSGGQRANNQSSASERYQGIVTERERWAGNGYLALMAVGQTYPRIAAVN